jgi:hypothetical protein
MKKHMKRSIAATCMVALFMSAAAPRARACPFCSAAMQTLSQEISGADVAVIAELTKVMPTAELDDTGAGVALPDSAAAEFRVVDSLRGEDKLAAGLEIRVVYFGQDPPGKKFLISGLSGVTGPGLDYTTPVPLSDDGVQYVRKLPGAPAQGADRLAFFQEYLEHADPLLAQDAYDEFSRAPYADVIALGPRMPREKILKWIEDPHVGPSNRRLYLTMLGVCGKPEDVKLLEAFINYDYQLMKPGVASLISTASLTSGALGVGLVDEVLHATERRKKESLDALVACYIKLKGPDALPLVNARFLANPHAEYKHLHSAIMALRFHGEETDVVPREKLLQSMRLALEHKEFADQVIPDLARWEDWSIMPRLVKMFKDSPADDWVRQPVVSYLLVAADQPGEVGTQAQAAIDELEALDKDTVERARSLQAFAIMPRAGAAPVPAANSAVPAVNAASAAPTGDAAPAATTGDASQTASPGQPESPASPSAGTAPAADASSTTTPAVPKIAAASAESPLKPAAPAPSSIKIIGVPLLAGAVLLAIFAVLLRGADPRSADESAA